ncbi:hypothetical protein [Actinomadura miaoliensis]|uniref:Uncharacterized protein n=1 Tax=Actinomadura miaoliensis TaxID=430685 RepID=A0ABP7WMN7_9ACTN
MQMHRRAGLRVLRRKGEAVMRAELAVGTALGEAAARWDGVPEGGVLSWRW